MRMYKIVQTGAKTELGGFQLGFWRAAYHVGIESAVKYPPTAPTARQMPTNPKSATRGFTNKFYAKWA